MSGRSKRGHVPHIKITAVNQRKAAELESQRKAAARQGITLQEYKARIPKPGPRSRKIP